MATIANTDKLLLKLTSYGLNRIAEAMSDSSVRLNISKIKVGDANGSYYVPTEEQTKLVNPLPEGTFYVIHKELLEDGVTVSFQSYIPETFGNCDIREVGLYETLDSGEDKLFAICTQQPLVKPDANYEYFIAVDYFIFLKSANLATVYEQIILNPDNQIITEEDLQEFMNSMLFTQGNLSYQIGNNTHVIGLDRPTQLYEQIVEIKNNLGYSATSGNYATFSGFAGSSNVVGYWVFNYPKRNSAPYSITDLSIFENNLSANQNINLFSQNSEGVLSTLKFQEPSYYYLPVDAPLNLYNKDLGEDYSFTMLFLLKPLDMTKTRTLLAKSNYAMDFHSFEINELNTGAIEVKLFTNGNNFITFTSTENIIPENDAHVLMISYKSSSSTLTGYINERLINFTKTVTGTYTHISEADTTLYGYSFTPYEIIYTDSTSSPTSLYNSDGSPYLGSDWSIMGSSIYFDSIQANYDGSRDTSTDTLYAWTYDDGICIHKIFTKELSISEDTVLYNEDYTEYTGSDFHIQEINSSFIIQYKSYSTTYNSEYNIQSKNLFCYVAFLSDVHIWSNSSTEPTVLFTDTGDIYTGDKWSINDYIITYLNQGEAIYDEAYNYSIATLNTTSFITDASGKPSQYINSDIGVIAVALTSLSANDMRLCVLELMAALGKNPCISVNN